MGNAKNLRNCGMERIEEIGQIPVGFKGREHYIGKA